MKVVNSSAGFSERCVCSSLEILETWVSKVLSNLISSGHTLSSSHTNYLHGCPVVHEVKPSWKRSIRNNISIFVFYITKMTASLWAILSVLLLQNFPSCGSIVWICQMTTEDLSADNFTKSQNSWSWGDLWRSPKSSLCLKTQVHYSRWFRTMRSLDYQEQALSRTQDF